MSDKNIIDKLDNIIELLEQEKLNKKSRVKIFSENILYGIGKGFGISVGFIIISAIFIMIMKELVSLPVIGQYIAKLVVIIESYLGEIKYK